MIESGFIHQDGESERRGTSTNVEPRQMHLNPLSLSFSGPNAHLETLFLDDYYQKSLTYIRGVLVLGAFLYGSFGVLDAVLLPLHKHLTWLIRFGFVCPAILLTVIFTYRPQFKSMMQPLFSAMVTFSGTGIIVMIVVAPPPVNYSYYAGLILAIFFGYTLVRMRFLWASLAGWAVVLLYEFAAIGLTDTPWPILLNNNFFFISANLMGMLACYAIEHYARRDFFLAHLLAEEQRKAKLANVLLEGRVRERTAELRQINKDLEEEIVEREKMEEERIRLQHQLKQAERMETIGKLASGVAHDLNNILSGLVSYPDILLMDLPEDSSLRMPILTMQKSGEKAAAVVQDLLSLSRQGVTVKGVVNLNTVVRDYLQSPEYEEMRSNHAHVRFETEIQEEPLNVMGSPFHISKMLTNLVNNAAEANLVDGTVRICTRNGYLDRPLNGYELIKEGEYAVLSVSDTGTGIAEEDLKRIFEPFYTKKQLGRSGTGLGMTLLWSAVKEHEGFIDVKSDEGKGSAFDLYLPATRRNVQDVERTLRLEDCRGTETLLVVDDVAEQREIATMMLQKLGYKLHSVESGEAALGFLRKRKVDLLLLDMIMEPGMDGCETYRRILEEHPGQKAIIASGFSESERVKEAQRLGAGPFIKKPYTLETLARTVRSELDRK